MARQECNGSCRIAQDGAECIHSKLAHPDGGEQPGASAAPTLLSACIEDGERAGGEQNRSAEGELCGIQRGSCEAISGSKRQPEASRGNQRYSDTNC